MMSVELPLDRPRARVLRRPGNGFSLVELLVVMAILGIIVLLGEGEILRAWKRQKTQSASNDIKILFQRAQSEMQRRNMQTFIQVGPRVDATTYMPIYLVGDADGDGTLATCFRNPPTGACPDLLIDEYHIKAGAGLDQEFCLSTVQTDQVASERWSGPNDTDWHNARSLMCDFQGRAIDTITRRQVAGPATLVFTNVSTVSHALMPPTRYVISVNPIWSVRVAKQIQDGTGTWVTRNG